eukprot:5314074-Pyramimonas_sp.AAC.1
MIDQRCTVVRLTEEYDMTTDAGLACAAKKIDNYCGTRIMLCGSSPRAGGSPWQCVNEVMHCRSGGDKALYIFLGSHDDVSEAAPGIAKACGDGNTIH